MHFVEPNTFYNMEDHEKEKYLIRVKEQVQKNELFKKMENIVKRTITNYENDFYVHDLSSLSEDSGDFVWLVRSAGTDLIRKGNDSFTPEGDWSAKLWFKAIIQTSRYEKIYYYNSVKETLRKIDFAKAVELVELFEEYNLKEHNIKSTA